MAERPKEYDLSLLQRDPHREARLGKMRVKLAGFAPPPAPEVRRRAAGRGKAATWAARAGILALVVAANYLLIGKKEVLLAHMGYEGVPSLPKPSAALSADDRALYYTYALYDIAKLRTRFGVQGHYAIDQRTARARLDDLLPKVSMPVLGEISGYAPVGFKSVSSGGNR